MDMAGMDTMSSSMDSGSSMTMNMTTMDMTMVFVNSHTTPLYSMMWAPTTAGGYAGTCIFLILLAVVFRALLAAKSVMEQRWLAQARNRRYVFVKGRNTEAGNINSNPDSKEASLVSANGVEENVKIVHTVAGGAQPFRLSVDVPRAFMVFFIAGVGYLLMLAVMTMNIGYFFSVLTGTFIGELALGRFSVFEEH